MPLLYGRTLPTISVADTPMLVPASLAGEQACSEKSVLLTNNGSALMIPMPAVPPIDTCTSE